ncbi:protein adenylyltransferase SelO [Pseudoalteromonas luteoviolacea]|uniref:protein adenylyltransferase SelO n=1 Tax=Pseudoalteromonas luteoviolacea TaxID=43657 RepID=UPI001B36391D|nr:YdiU family protein [Pseudoalteromonas luteoviolacea]MBQ4839341.1 YdiU family protein [Pseudoalteromonas luteoviolacea]
MFYSRYAPIGEKFAVPAIPNDFNNAKVTVFNTELNTQLGLNWNLETAQYYLSGSRPLPGAQSVCLAYSGHQFGQFNPTLGDGRAHLIGSFKARDRETFDIQLKGSGATVFSRGGDGLCALGPAIREFVMSKALSSLGVPSTQCLAVLSTGDSVYRQGELPGAVVARVAHSHIRVGSFQYLAVQQDSEAMLKLLELAMKDVGLESNGLAEEDIFSFFQFVCDAQCDLILKWLQVGFIHGVMNTDNTLINGETIDYGPCAMMESFSFNRVFSSIDRQGRYAFGQQPNMASWNCGRLAESLLLLIEDEQVAIERFSKILAGFSERFNQGYKQLWHNKLGLLDEQPGDQDLITALLEVMTRHELDFTNTFASLTAIKINRQQLQYPIPPELDEWVNKWKARIQDHESSEVAAVMQQHNPAIIPRNDVLEEVIRDFYQYGNSDILDSWLEALSVPYNYDNYPEKWLLSQTNTKSYQTFCGT